MHDRETVELALLALEEGWSAQGLVELRRRGLSTPATNPLWVADITEFRLPGGAGKCCPSAVVDCLDGRRALGWLTLNEHRRALDYAA